MPFTTTSSSSLSSRSSLVSLIFVFIVLINPLLVLAANKDQWRTRSIYQLITDRFAPPSATAPALTQGIKEDGTADCPPGTQNWCGGTWRTIVDKLDYIQGMGFDAIWISPTSKNIDVATAYGAAYHGYWVQDPTLLNPRFGDANDLKALSAELHKRNMFLMVDIVVNNVVANPADTIGHIIEQNPALIWRKEEQYHAYCPMDYSNATSEEFCWMGDEKLPLVDVNTEHVEVIQGLQAWITSFVQEYGVDGLRIDAAKHVRPEFWQPFCAAAGVFCMGEVYGNNIAVSSAFQSLGYLDSILNFPSYFGASAAFFEQPNTPLNMSHLVDMHSQVQSAFLDVGVLGSFLGNHDLPRYHGLQVDPRTAWNALVWQFMSEGIPTVFYGDEQELGSGDLAGRGDPYNRPALWAPGNGNYDVTKGTYVNIAQLNKIRKFLIASDTKLNGKNFLNNNLEFLQWNDHDMVFRRGPILVVLTNRGSPSVAASVGITETGWKGNIVNILECDNYSVGSNSSILVSYAPAGDGGKPYIFMAYEDAAATGLCPNIVAYSTNTTQAQARIQPNAANTLAGNTWAVSFVVLALLSVIASVCLV